VAIATESARRDEERDRRSGLFAEEHGLAGLTRAANEKARRHQAIREVVGRAPVASQRDLVEELSRRGFDVTTATVSRDAAELGLVRLARADGHRYVLPEDVAQAPASDDRLRRLIADMPIPVGRSGLILLLVGAPGTASAIAQAIDESSFTEHEGTLAGDNTTLVLFADEPHLERWQAHFRELQGLPAPASRRTPSRTQARSSAPRSRTRTTPGGRR
jgi:transcriptional regulator of arginine metabolism